MPPTELKPGDEVVDDSGWLVMRHRETGGLSRQTRDAFMLNYRHNNWEEVTKENSSTEQLVAAAEVLGVTAAHYGIEVDQYGDPVGVSAPTPPPPPPADADKAKEGGK